MTTPGSDGALRGHVTQIQRARMLAAVVEAIDSSGYSQLTVTQVISRAKVSRKTFYDLFADREDCFLAAFEQTIAQVGAGVREAYDLQVSWRDAVRAGMAELLRFIDQEPSLARLCIVDALAGGPKVLQARAELMSAVHQAIDLGRAEASSRRELPAVTAEGVTGAVFAVIHSRLMERSPKPYIELLGPLMSMIVLPYLGPRAASRELSRPAPASSRRAQAVGEGLSTDPMEGLDMRLTYRTVRVLSAIRERPGASNREVADGAGIADQGQISKLLRRLEHLALLENSKVEHPKPNEWHLTERGKRVERAARRS